jgi:NitT/TauT family transport system permease protein
MKAHRATNGGATLLDRWTSPLLILVGLLAWELCSRTELISFTFFPPPSAIVATLLELIASGEVTRHAGATLARVLLGFLLGGGAGLLLGLVMGSSVRLRTRIDPLIALLHPVPKIAALPLILVIFGIGEAPKLVLASLGAFFPMLINTMAGVRQIPPGYLEVARSYGAGRLDLLRRVILPGSLPLIFTGARLALNVALVLTIAAELVVGQTGLGQRTWFAWQTMRISEVYSWLAVSSALGAGLSLSLGWLSTVCMPWRQDDGADRR